MADGEPQQVFESRSDETGRSYSESRVSVFDLTYMRIKVAGHERRRERRRAEGAGYRRLS